MAESRTEATPSPTRRRWGYRIGFAVVALIVVAVVGLVPVALVSLAQRIRHSPSARVEVFVPREATTGSAFSAIHLDEVALDETGRMLAVRVTGYRVCRGACPTQDTLVFFAGLPESRVVAGLPPAATVALPMTTAPVNTTISLPVAGRLLFYPFDRYRLVVALGLERQTPGQPPRFLRPPEVAGQLYVTAQEIVPRLESSLVPVPPGDRQPLAGGFAYLGVWDLDFRRPRYLQVLVGLAVLLVAAAAIYAVLLRPLPVLIINTGGLILGVWGIRSLLLGSLPADVTIVDMALTAIIFALLALVTVRVMNYLHAQAGLRLLPWARPRSGSATPPDEE